MHPFWEYVIRPLLECVHARTIGEIGVARGATTVKLLAYAQEVHGTIHAIDPEPQLQEATLSEEMRKHLVMHREISLSALLHIEPCDAILIDGDHNWYTVYNELLTLEKLSRESGKFPMVFLHDINWPYGRRDCYWNPELIPEAYRLPYARKGIVPGKNVLQENHGFNPHVYHALYESAVQCGIRTAIDDFLMQTRLPLKFIAIPGFHGLGILVPQAYIAQYPELEPALDALRISAPMERHVNALEERWIQLRNEQYETEAHIASLTHQIHDLQDTMNETRRGDESEQKVEYSDAEQEEQLQWTTLELKNTRSLLRSKQEELQKLRDRLLQSETDFELMREEMMTQNALLQKATEEKQQWEDTSMALQKTLDDSTQKLTQAFQQTEAAEALIVHMQRTQSWKITAPLRAIGGYVRRIRSGNWAYAIFANLKDLWTDFDKPFPRLVYFVRHGLLGKRWPVHEPQTSVNTVVPAPKSPPELKCIAPTPRPVSSEPIPVVPVQPKSVTGLEIPNDVAVVIPCHNYAHFLSDAIDSVLAQTVQPKDILVVDDASDDNTREVAERYADKGVRYLRGEWRSVGAARNTGIAETDAPYLVFLDADNILHPEYVRHGLQTLNEYPHVAIAYCNLQNFGDDDKLRNFPDTLDWQRFECHNHIDACAMVRRDALKQVGGFSHGIDQDGDWVTWRKLLKLGWKAVNSQSLCFYRYHANNMSHDLRKKGYAVRSGFLEDDATLCIILHTADAVMWQQTAGFLQRQTYPHNKIHLVVIDNTGDDELEKAVRRTLADLDYDAHTYLREPPIMAEEVQTDLSKEVLQARSLNRLGRLISDGLVFLVGEDIVPPDNVFHSLIGHFASEVLSVSATASDKGTRVWHWSDNGVPRYVDSGSGVGEVGGSSFECTVVRGAFFNHTTFQSERPHTDSVLNFYAKFRANQFLQNLVDWSVTCARSRPLST